jgi:hypothetical protein
VTGRLHLIAYAEVLTRMMVVLEYKKKLFLETVCLDLISEAVNAWYLIQAT